MVRPPRRGLDRRIVAWTRRLPFTEAWIVAAITLGCGVAGAQTVSPPSLTIGSSSAVCAASSVVERVCVQLPPAATADKIDFFGLFDDTSSFQDIVPTLGEVFTLLVGDLETALPGVDFGFGVGRFEDYGGPGFGFGAESQSGRPFTLNQPIVTSAAAGSPDARNQLIVDALGRSAPGNGGDGPEAALEGLYQVATGAGFDGDGDGGTTGLGGQQVAGSAAAQSTPDVSGDVPAFSSLAPEVIRAGSIGGAGFRPDAIHLVILATDQCPVASFDPTLPIPEQLQASGATVPITEFACSSTDPGDNRFGFTSAVKAKGDDDLSVAPSGAAHVPAVVEALNAAAIGVIGVFPTVEGSEPRPGPRLGPTFGADAFLTGLARLTGTIDSNGTPLVFDIDDVGPVLRAAVIDAISAAASRPIDVRIGLGGVLPAGMRLIVPVQHIVEDVPPSGQACFDVTLEGSGQPQGMFALEFQDPQTSRVLASVPVTVACNARCGDGTVDAVLAEQCDAGAANGAPGSCCDATCRMVAAGTVCRDGSGTCDAAAVCDGASATCPDSTSLEDGRLCDDGDAATGTSACVGAACRGVELGIAVVSEIDAPDDLKQTRIPVVLDLADGLDQATVLQIQAFVSCDDLPALSACATKACRQLDRQLAQQCGASTTAVAQGRGTPAGLVAVSAAKSRKLKRSRRGQLRVPVKLNKTGRTLLSRSTALLLEVHVETRERGGDTLDAHFETLLRR